MGVAATILGAIAKAGLEITSNGAARVADVPRPPLDWTQAEVEQKKVLVGLLTSNADATAMAVSGTAAAPVDYEIGASATEIRWVTEIRLIHHSTLMKLDSNEIRRFGPAAAAPGLTNGVLLVVDQGGDTTQVFTAAGVKNIEDYSRYAETVTGQTDGVSAGVDTLVVRYILPQPVGIYPGSKDRVYIKVQDDLSGLALFEATYLGWRETL